MPEVQVRYLGLIRTLPARGHECFVVAPGTRLRDLLEEIGERHGLDRGGPLLLAESGRLADGVFVLLESGEKPDLDWTFACDTPVTLVVASPMVVGG